MASTTTLGLHAPIGADPQEPATALTRLADPTDVAILAAQLDALIPQPGFLQATASATVPAGWLACDGAAVSRSTYARLFAAVGTTYGAGNGTTTFNVPDTTGRVLVTADGAADRITGSHSQSLGGSGGVDYVTLSTANVPQYTGIGGATTGVSLQTGTVTAATATENMQPYLVVNMLVKT